MFVCTLFSWRMLYGITCICRLAKLLNKLGHEEVLNIVWLTRIINMNGMAY